MSIKTPRLTRDRCGVFYIRLVVPLTLRQDIGKSELRRSLRTKDCAIAKQRALTLNLALQKWRAEKPDLFVKRVYEHAGLDS